ncbi:MAG: hypothetical protein AAB601_03010 [Patescibacteria group bacterium]
MNKTIMKWTLPLGVAALLAVPFLSSAAGNKVTICHATDSATNPYVEITVSEYGWLNGHMGHGDFLAPPEGCSVSDVPSIQFAADRTVITNLDDPIIFTWSSTGVDSCVASYDPWDPYVPVEDTWWGTVATEGTKSVSPTGTGNTLYTLTCAGPDGPLSASVEVVFFNPS